MFEVSIVSLKSLRFVPMFAAMLFSEVFLDSTLLGFSIIDAWIAESQVVIVLVGTRNAVGPSMRRLLWNGARAVRVPIHFVHDSPILPAFLVLNHCASSLRAF